MGQFEIAEDTATLALAAWPATLEPTHASHDRGAAVLLEQRSDYSGAREVVPRC